VLITIVGVAVAATACVLPPGSSDVANSPAISSQEVTTSMAPIGEVPGDLLDAIVNDAAERAGIQRDEVEVLTAESVTWNDGSLGCPEPGMMYTQALVPGYRVVVEAGGEEMHFHASERGSFRFCENPKPPMDVSPNE
jgi:hypothetical protein